ncbi:hypothetical protein DY000_02042308 [Brassica cretica]|uniref:Uncharacterized protein n=1 Tax=Brassica cretica TaxID=69181 RepID=A0ABQ7BLW0_BRACR|nr:hypothetical protein DY000_02042308 [Brassica cretica]
MSTNNCVIWNVTFPEPMLLPNSSHLFNGNTSGLRKQKVDEDGHDGNHACKEVEETKLHVTKHCQEELTDEESEEHVD